MSAPAVDGAPPRRHVPGEPGVWVFVIGDVLIFTALFLTYAVYRAQDRAGFAAAQAQLSVGVGLANTILLLVSSALVLGGVGAARRGDARASVRLLLAAMGCGVAFSVIKIVEWSASFARGVTAATHEFFVYYFLTTGLHWFHLLMGLVFLGFAVATVRRGPLRPTGRAYLEGAACFWHMVDLLWVVIFPLLYLTR